MVDPGPVMPPDLGARADCGAPHTADDARLIHVGRKRSHHDGVEWDRAWLMSSVDARLVYIGKTGPEGRGVEWEGLLMADDMPLPAHLAALAEPGLNSATANDSDLPVNMDTNGPAPQMSATLIHEGDTMAGDESTLIPPASRIRGRKELKSEWERLLMVDQPMPAHLRALVEPRKPAAAVEALLVRDGQDGEEETLIPPAAAQQQGAEHQGNVQWEELLMALQQPMPAHLRALAEPRRPAPILDGGLVYEGAADVLDESTLISPAALVARGGGGKRDILELERRLISGSSEIEPAHLRALAEPSRPAPAVVATLLFEDQGEMTPADASSPILPAAHGEHRLASPRSKGPDWQGKLLVLGEGSMFSP